MEKPKIPSVVTLTSDIFYWNGCHKMDVLGWNMVSGGLGKCFWEMKQMASEKILLKSVVRQEKTLLGTSQD